MAAVNISIDVHCTVGHGEPVYRIYVDNELLTERSWVWPSYEVLIKEIIEVNFEDYGLHTLKLENCSVPNNFYFTSVHVNGNEVQQWEKRKSKAIEDQATQVKQRLQEITFTA